MDDDPITQRPPVTRSIIRSGSSRHGRAAERALDEIIPLQPLSGKPISNGREALVALRDRSMDAEQGFATMVAKAEPEFHDVAESYRALHDRHASAIGQILTGRGLPLDAEGSFMGNVNSAVVSVRAFFDRIDEDAMVEVRYGEKTVLQAFDVALAAPLLGTEAATLRRMRDELIPTALVRDSFRIPRFAEL